MNEEYKAFRNSKITGKQEVGIYNIQKINLFILIQT